MKIEQQLEHLIRKASMANREKTMFDKKADEATIELIVAQEELEAVREEKKSVEKSIEEIKSELVKFMKTAREKQRETGDMPLTTTTMADNYDTTVGGVTVHHLSEQARVLKSLNREIEVKRREIDELREKSEQYLRELKSETSAHQSENDGLRAQKEQLSGQLKQLRTKIDEAVGELDERGKQLEASRVELERVVKSKERETKCLREIEASLAEKRLGFC